jgi:membrane-associated phospholipid phosphatase
MAGSIQRSLARLSLYRLDLDRWAVVYLVVSAAYPILKPSLVPNPWPRFLLHVALAVAVWFLPPLLRRSRQKLLRLIGEIYLPFIFPLFYSEMGQLGLVFHGFRDSLDPWFIRLEQNIFGLQPSLEWSRAWPWPWLHELMELSYFSYYFVSVGVLAMILLSKGFAPAQRWTAVRAFARDLGAVMLICYTLYTFLPVWGPKYFQAGPVEVPGWIFTKIMTYIHGQHAILGAAFPSSHVAGTLIPWWYVWHLFPRSRWWMTILFVLVCLATVYCRYHYVVDVIGGLLLGGLVLWLGARFGETYTRQPKPDFGQS